MSNAAVEVPKTLVEKLAAACDEVGGVEKRGKNTSQNYEYVKAADVAKAIRHELFSRGIILIADEESLEWIEFETKSGTVMKECRLKVAYRIRDAKEEIVVHAFGVGMDAGDKAIYKAKTGAQKYFLRGLGLIPDEKDDVEADESVDREVMTRRPPAPNGHKPGEGLVVADFQKNAFMAAAKKSGKTNQELLGYYGSIGIEQLDEMLKKNFPDALKWAMNSEVA